MTKFLNISTDNTLGGNSPSDAVVSSQKAIKDHIDAVKLGDLANVSLSSPSTGQNLTYDATNQVWKNTSVSATVAWGGVTGTLSDQADLQNALNAKQNILTAGSGIDITSNTISAIGVKNKNTAAGAVNPVYNWVGTLAQWEAQDVANQHPDWICFITDDAREDWGSITDPVGLVEDWGLITEPAD